MATPRAPKVKRNGRVKKAAVGADEITLALPEQKRTYTFRDGTTVELLPILWLLLIGAQSTHDKPQAPKRKRAMAGGGVVEEPREDDEDVLTEEEIEKIKDPEKRQAEAEYRAFREKLAEWEINSEFRMARTLFLLGVKDGPPPDAVQLFRIIGWREDHEIKYAWLASKLLSEDDISDFFDAVTKQTNPTKGGMSEAEEMFRGAVAGEPPVAVARPVRVSPVAGDEGQPQAEGQAEAKTD